MLPWQPLFISFMKYLVLKKQCFEIIDYNSSVKKGARGFCMDIFLVRRFNIKMTAKLMHVMLLRRYDRLGRRLCDSQVKRL